MRYYRLEISNTDGSPFAVFTSFPNGATDLGAPQIEFDVPVVPLATPGNGGASIKVWGVSLQTISQSRDFNGKLLRLYTGMQAGLPLANPAQAGLILEGAIFQAFGNWVQTAQWVEFIVITNGAELGQRLNIVLDWAKGATLADAIRQTLAVAAPSYKVDIAISPKLVLGQHEAGFYQNMVQFAQYLKQASAAIIGGDYQGVDVLLTEKAFTISDGTTAKAPKAINFQDLIGQPTWIDPATIQVMTVMRADLQPNDYVKLPETQVTTTAAAATSIYRDRSVFQGAFRIDEMRHVGNLRQPDALAWVTTMNCRPTVNVAA